MITFLILAIFKSGTACRFLEAQGTEAVLAVMERYEQTPKLQRQACWAVLTVAGSDEIARAVAEFPVGAAVVSALVNHRYYSQSVLSMFCHILMFCLLTDTMWVSSNSDAGR